MFYDRQGRPISPQQWEAIPRRERKIVHKTLLHNGKPVSVITDWDGQDWAEGRAPVPMVFSTCILKDGKLESLAPWPDERIARQGHAMMVAALKADGAKTGVRTIPYWIGRGQREQKSVKAGWFMVAMWSLLIVLYTGPVLMSALLMEFSWSAAVNGVFIVWASWMLKNSLIGLKRAMKRRDQENVDKAFEEIVKNAQD